jgi:hypothetical protein
MTLKPAGASSHFCQLSSGISNSVRMISRVAMYRNVPALTLVGFAVPVYVREHRSDKPLRIPALSTSTGGEQGNPDVDRCGPASASSMPRRATLRDHRSGRYRPAASGADLVLGRPEHEDHERRRGRQESLHETPGPARSLELVLRDRPRGSPDFSASYRTTVRPVLPQATIPPRSAQQFPADPHPAPPKQKCEMCRCDSRFPTAPGARAKRIPPSAATSPDPPPPRPSACGVTQLSQDEPCAYPIHAMLSLSAPIFTACPVSAS